MITTNAVGATILNCRMCEMGLSLEERMSLDDDLKALDDLRHAIREYYEMDFSALYNFR